MQSAQLDKLIKEYGFDRAYVLPAASLGGEWESFYAARPDYGLVLDPASKFPWASSILFLVRAYVPFRVESGLPGYYIASNAGYHAANALCAKLDLTGYRARQFSPPMKALALENHIGIQRKNSLIDIPGFGTRIALFALATDIGRSAGQARGPYQMPEPCNDCDICAKACPVGAIDKDGGLDYTKCIRDFMWKRDMPDWVKAKLPGLLGCEVCQAVCPRNAFIGVREPTAREEYALDLKRLMKAEIAEARTLVGKNMCSNGRLQAQASVLDEKEKRKDLK